MDIKDMKRGEWMPGNVKPEAPGVYERDYSSVGSVNMLAVWTGTVWSWPGTTPRGAMLNKKHISQHQYLPWRGQLEYDPNLAPPGFVAEPRLGCGGCDLDRVGDDCLGVPCAPMYRPDGRSVIMKRAKP